VQKARDVANPTPYVVANVHVTRRLCDAAVRAKVRRIVLASSVKVYGESTRKGRPFRAGDPAAPRDVYAQSKAEAERVLWQASEESALEGVVLRLPLTYGAGVKGNFLTLTEAIAARRKLPLAGIGNRRSLLNVDNAVSAIAAALTVPALAGQTLPIADNESVSTSELAQRIGNALGVPARLFHLPAPLLRAGAALTGRRAAAARLLGSLEVDAQQFCDLAGWSQPHTLDEGLAATAAWWRLRHAL
jgi:nucleoside-diphosphate-sugar epimerase